MNYEGKIKFQHIEWPIWSCLVMWNSGTFLIQWDHQEFHLGDILSWLHHHKFQQVEPHVVTEATSSSPYCALECQKLRFWLNFVKIITQDWLNHYQNSFISAHISNVHIPLILVILWFGSWENSFNWENGVSPQRSGHSLSLMLEGWVLGFSGISNSVNIDSFSL